MPVGRMPCAFSSRTREASIEEGRPLQTPAAFALAMPSSWRSRRRLVSNSVFEPAPPAYEGSRIAGRRKKDHGAHLAAASGAAMIVSVKKEPVLLACGGRIADDPGRAHHMGTAVFHDRCAHRRRDCSLDDAAHLCEGVAGTPECGHEVRSDFCLGDLQPWTRGLWLFADHTGP
jgi:hypothetical protein